jgi:DNA-binding CsgD family transcriptional regulator
VRQVLCPILVGRDEEVGLLGDALAAARAGAGAAVFLVGEAGIGKTRLARETAVLARRLNLAVHVGRAMDAASPAPFRPLTEALMSAVRRCGLPDGADLDPFRGALGRLVPEWRGAGSTAEDDSAVVLGEAVLRLLRALAGGAGSLLVLEDLHWADAETLDVVEYLADNTHSEPLLLLVTARSDESPAIASLARVLQARGCATVVTLSRLAQPDVERMTQATLDGADLPVDLWQLVDSWAEGVPLLVEDLLAELIGTGAMVRRGAGWVLEGPTEAPLPAGFRHAVQQRTARLSADDRYVLAAAAVVGHHFDWTLLPAVTGRPEPAVLDLMRTAMAAQLVVADADGFRFRHAHTRDAVLAGLLPPERAELAGHALAAVCAVHPDLEGGWCELASELAESAGDSRTASSLLLESARRALARGALVTAEQTLTRGRRLAEDRALAVQIEETLVEVLALAGKADQALARGGRVLEDLAELGATAERRAEIHLRLARAAATAASWELAGSHLRQAGALVGNGHDDGLLARIDAAAAEVALGVREPEEAAVRARSAFDGAQRADLPDVACEALEILGRCARLRDLREAQDVFAQAESLAARHHLMLRRIRALHELATIDALSVNGSARLVEARELAARAGALAVTATLDIQLAGIHYGAFEVDQLLQAATRAEATARRFRLGHMLPMAVLWQAAGHGLRGDRPAMEAAIGDALDVAGDDPDASAMAWGWCRAACSLLEDDREAAAAQLDRAADVLRGAPAVNPWGFRGLWALLRTVDDRAGAAARAEVHDSGATVYGMNRGYLALAEAVARGRLGDAQGAQARFADGDDALSPWPWFRHYARCLVSEPAVVDGWGEPAGWLREDVVFFEDRGHPRQAARCRSLLRRAGAPLPRRGRGESTVPGRLRALGVTSREMDVLLLVAERLGNKEIAARLYLSPRTVEKHVASLVGKAAVRDRLELVGFADAHLDRAAGGP